MLAEIWFALFVVIVAGYRSSTASTWASGC